MSRLAFISLLSVITLVIAIILNHQQESSDNLSESNIAKNNEPDFYMRDAKSVEYNQLGKVRFRFKATDVNHFPQGDFTLVNNPDMTLFRKGSPWNIISKEGHISPDGKIITLTKDVKLRGGTPEQPLQMETQSITILPDKNLAKTKQKVLIINNSGRINAKGMNAYLDENRMELLSNVKVRHDPIKTN